MSMEKALPTPPWLYLLNALQKDWREAEISKGRNPDLHIAKQLHEEGRWPAERISQEALRTRTALSM
jgi:hypothetical protein